MREWLKRSTVLRMIRAVFRFRLSKIADAIIIGTIRNIDGPIGDTLRYEYYRDKLKSIGRNVKIDTSVFITGPEYISIGDNVHVDKGVILVACAPSLDLSARDLKVADVPDSGVSVGELRIGSCVHIAPRCLIAAYGGVRIGSGSVLSAGCMIYSLTNVPRSPVDPRDHVSIMPYSGRSPSLIGPIVLEDNVWIGLNCCVFPGVVIGKDSFARSGSFIVTSAPENSYLRGDPAVRVNSRYKDIECATVTCAASGRHGRNY